MTKHTIKIARPSDRDFDMAYMIQGLSELFDDRFSVEEDWKSWDEESEKYKLMKEAYDSVLEEDGPDSVFTDDPDNRLVIYEYIRRLFINYPSALYRVIAAAQMAMDNCFDKDISYIDYRPNVKNAMFYHINHKDEVDTWCREHENEDDE